MEQHLWGLTCTAAVGIFHSHYLNHVNFPTSSVPSELFGEITFPARVAVPNQYPIDWNSQFLAKGNGFINNQMVRLGIGLFVRLQIQNLQISGFLHLVEYRVVKRCPIPRPIRY